MNYTYMVRCSDGSLYCGWTNNLQQRLAAHNHGNSGARCTRSRRPVYLVYYEGYRTRQEAMRREWELKHYSRQRKEKLLSFLREPDTVQSINTDEQRDRRVRAE